MIFMFLGAMLMDNIRVGISQIILTSQLKKIEKRINKIMAVTIAEFFQQQSKSVFGLKRVIENFGFHLNSRIDRP